MNAILQKRQKRKHSITSITDVRRMFLNSTVQLALTELDSRSMGREFVTKKAGSCRFTRGHKSFGARLLIVVGPAAQVDPKPKVSRIPGDPGGESPPRFN